MDAWDVLAPGLGDSGGGGGGGGNEILDIIQGAGSLLPSIQSMMDRFRARNDRARGDLIRAMLDQFNTAQGGYGGMFGSRPDGTPLSAQEGYASYLADYLSQPGVGQQAIAGLATIGNSLAASPSWHSVMPGRENEIAYQNNMPQFAMPASMAASQTPGVIQAIEPVQPNVQPPDWSNTPAPEPIREPQTARSRFEDWLSGDRRPGQTVADILERVSTNMQGAGDRFRERRNERASSKSSVSDVPHYATGTPSAAGGWSMVGERGPELANLQQGTPVVPLGTGQMPQMPAPTEFAFPKPPQSSTMDPRSPIYQRLAANPSGSNQGLQNAMYGRQENLINSQYQELMRQQREQGAAAGQLGSGNFQRRMFDTGQGRVQALAGARSDIDIAAQQNEFQNLLQSAGLEQGRQLGFGNLALGQGQLALQGELGRGQLGLSQQELALQRQLGLGNLSLAQEQFGANRGFTQQQLDILRNQSELEGQISTGQLGLSEQALINSSSQATFNNAMTIYNAQIQAGATQQQAYDAYMEALAAGQNPVAEGEAYSNMYV